MNKYKLLIKLQYFQHQEMQLLLNKCQLVKIVRRHKFCRRSLELKDQKAQLLC